jgi:hypothetical protein
MTPTSWEKKTINNYYYPHALIDNVKDEKKTKKSIKILKKLTNSVRFYFYKHETKKIEPNRTQIEKNRARPEN